MNATSARTVRRDAAENRKRLRSVMETSR